MVDSWEIPKTIEQATWFWRGRQEQYFEESCAFPVGKNLERQCLNNPGYGPNGLYCQKHSKIIRQRGW